MRRLAARAHLWGGLLLGPVILVLGLSGAALVFREELDALGGVPVTVAGGPPRALDAIVASALLTEPGGEARALRIPARSDQPYRVQIVHGACRVDVAVDPVTLRVLASRAPERSVLAAVRALHAGFHAGRWGAVAVGLIGVALVIESVGGLWLYGPRLRVRASRARPRGRSRLVHRVVGGASLAVGLVVGVTGVALALAGGTLAALVAAGGGLVRAELREGTTVLLDRETLAVVAVRPASLGVWDVVRRLHYGDFAGWPSRLAWTLAGLALPALTITGYLAATRPRASS